MVPDSMDERFGPFRMLARLGRGGMAETYVAERVGPAGFVQRVCIKRVLEEHGSDPDFVRLFQNEARLAALLQHPNIVSVYDFGCERGSWWMSLELIEGLDLRSLIAGLRATSRPVPLDIVLLVAAELSKALAYAHSRAMPDGSPAGIVHRDVSPSNVLVSYEGAIKLADFGIAKATHQDQRTRSGVVKGKAPYMAPEQAQGLEIDGRVDLFALGVILFELLAGQRPFDGASEFATLQNIVENRRKNLRDLAPQTPPRLIEIIDALIEPDREIRTRTAHEVLDALCALPSPPSVVRVLGVLARSVLPPEVIPREGALTSKDQIAALGSRAEVVDSSRPTPTAATVPERLGLHGGRDHDAGSAPEDARDTRQATPLATGSRSRRARRSRVLTLAIGLGTIVLATSATIAVSTSSPPEPSAALEPSASPGVVAMRDERRPSESLLPAARPAEPRDSQEELSLPAEPAALPAIERAARRPSPRPPTSPTTEPQPTARPATLRVIVHPIGRVVIDGRDVGESPIARELAAGRHIVEGVRDFERVRQVVELEPGEERELVVRLE